MEEEEAQKRMGTFFYCHITRTHIAVTARQAPSPKQRAYPIQAQLLWSSAPPWWIVATVLNSDLIADSKSGAPHRSCPSKTFGTTDSAGDSDCDWPEIRLMPCG